MNWKLILRLLQNFQQEDDDSGFSWLELLVAIMIIGILAAIVFPYLATCGQNKAVRSEARYAVGSMNRAQQAYFLEKQAFAKSFKELGLGIKEQTKNYTYYTQPTKNGVLNYAIAQREYVYFSWFEKRPVNSYVGVVFTIIDPKSSELLVRAITCENDLPGAIKPVAPTYSQGVFVCGKGTRELQQ